MWSSPNRTRQGKYPSFDFESSSDWSLWLQNIPTNCVQLPNMFTGSESVWMYNTVCVRYSVNLAHECTGMLRLYTCEFPGFVFVWDQCLLDYRPCGFSLLETPIDKTDPHPHGIILTNKAHYCRLTLWSHLRPDANAMLHQPFEP